jgi:uncharacterized protein
LFVDAARSSFGHEWARSDRSALFASLYMKITVKVKPNSKQQKIEETEQGNLIIFLKSPPIDGKTNKELIEIIAKKYRVPKTKVLIKSGLNSKNKILEINF